MKKNRKIKIFVGYQLTSNYHTPKEIKRAVSTIKKLVKTKVDLELEIQYGQFTPGKSLFSEVFNAVNGCEIAIFDISENNPNVLIEAGLAYGNGKYVLLLKNELSKERYPRPSDITGFIYVPYNKKKTVSHHNICNQIANAIIRYNRDISKSPLYFKLLWGFNETDTVYIICPNLDKPKKRQEPEPKEFLYLGKYGDIDSLMAVHASLIHLYPKLDIKFCTSEEFNSLPGSPYTDNLVLIGGPDYNKITKAFMKHTPFEFMETDDGDTVLNYKKSGPARTFGSKCNANEIEEDFGFFFKISNPNNRNKKLIMINGIHTYGVYGAAKCFSFYDASEREIAENNCKKVIEKLGGDPNFSVILKVTILNKNKIVIPYVENERVVKE